MPDLPPARAPRVLVVDDHRKIREPLAVYLRRYGFEVRTTEDAAGMWQLLKRQSFDVVILDVLLPDGNGFELCERLHREGEVGVILLTARDTPADRVRGLDLGADDYVTKPFEPRELVARLHSVLRRRPTAATGPGRVLAAPAPRARGYTFNGWHFSPGSARLTRIASVETVQAAATAGQPAVVTLVIQLSTVESRLLQVFLDHPHIALPRERLIALSAADSELNDRSIDRQISRLRRKLASSPCALPLLRTVWGSGYLLACEVQLCSA
jgi:two-component system OmpR family response regulator